MVVLSAVLSNGYAVAPSGRQSAIVFVPDNLKRCILNNMDVIETFNKVREEYENALSSFGRAMILIDQNSNIIYANREAKEILSTSDSDDRLTGKKWTSIVETTSLATGGTLDEKDRPSAAALLAAQATSRIFFISPTYTSERTLVALTAVPLILGGEIAGGIIILNIKVQ